MAEYAETSPRPPQARTPTPYVPDNQHANVGDFERILSLLGGGTLLLYGLRRSLGHLMLMFGGGALMYRGLTGYCPAYQAIGVSTVSPDSAPGILLEATITVNKTAAEVYRFWHRVENHPRFMQHLESVVSLGDKRARWAAKGPLAMPITWGADLIEERPHTLLSWRSLPGEAVDHMGTVRLRELPDGRGTEVRLRLEYAPPGGMTGVALAKLFKTLTVQQLKEDLRCFKQIIEAGETPTIAHQPAAATSTRQRSVVQRGANVL